jgi:periplasmic divalent cation tolerance protein
MQAMTPKDAILVLTNLPNTASAEKLANLLISEKLAACVNIGAMCLCLFMARKVREIK